MDKQLYSEFVSILKEELVPATGCTEPIAISYISALASSLIEEKIEAVDIYVSSNIMKNCKSVIVPNTNGERGIESAVAAGIVARSPEKKLSLLSSLRDDDIKKITAFRNENRIKVHRSPREYVFSLLVSLRSRSHKVEAEIAGNHTNVIYLSLDGKALIEKEYKEKNLNKTGLLTVSNIVEFANECDIKDVGNIIEREIKCNMEIAKEGLGGNWGANVGSILLSSYGDSVQNRAKAYAAAASDARMGGAEKCVIINSGSGNQGITVSLPVIIYAEELRVERDLLIRALVVSNLVAIHIKSKIGPLSAYCGATSASCGAASGISYLYGGRENEISHAVVNTLAIVSGMICDGAKPSCAAKIASAVEAGLIGFEMTRHESEFLSGDGIVTKGVENTIDNIVELASIGMKETDKTIINIMTRKKDSS